MKTVVALVVVLLTCPASDASAQVARVTAERTNLRDRPATDGAIVASLARGDELDVIERSGSWYRVRVRSTGQEGFVSSLLVETTGSAPAPAAVPAAPPSTPATPAAPQAVPTPDLSPAQPSSTPSSGGKSFELGVRLGLNRSTVDASEDDEEELSARTALAGGGLARLWLGDRLAVQVEAMFSPQGARFDFGRQFSDDIDDVVLKLDYLQVPVLGMLSFGSGGVRPFVLAGPVVGFRLAAKVEAGDADEDVGEFLSTSDFGVMFGGGVDVGRLTFDARLLQGVKNIEVESESDAVTRNRVLMFGVGFRF